eukprot:gene21275-23346_t
MSINGEITAVHFSRKSSAQDQPGGNLFGETVNRNDKQLISRHKRSDRPKSGRRQDPVRRESSPTGEQLLRADSDQIDLDRLLHSVLDINDYESRLQQTNAKGKRRPFSAHQLTSSSSTRAREDLFHERDDERRSIMSEGISGRVISQRPFSAQIPSVRNRTNYSFSNHTVDKIDRENQRLLKEIMRHQAKKSSSKQTTVKKFEPVRVKSVAALNRNKLQAQIERENLAMLRRLEKVKPTKELSRQHLLKEHFKQEQISSNISKGKRPPPGGGLRSRRSSSLSDISQRDGDSVLSYPAFVSSSRNPGSTGRPISAKTQKHVNTRPVWDAGW